MLSKGAELREDPERMAIIRGVCAWRWDTPLGAKYGMIWDYKRRTSNKRRENDD